MKYDIMWYITDHAMLSTIGVCGISPSHHFKGLLSMSLIHTDFK